MGARLQTPPGVEPGLDVDRFDAHCEHLVVRTVASATAPAQVVGTYRVLMPAAARRLGGLYSDTDTATPNSTWCGWRACAPAWLNWGDRALPRVGATAVWC